VAKGLGGLNGILIGAALGAGLLYAVEHLKSFSISGSIAPPIASGPAMAHANVGILPGNELPFYDYEDDSYVGSNVWDRRTTVYRNDGVLYNTTGPVFTDGTTSFHPEKRLNLAGAYGNDLEDGPRPRQEHAGGNFPQCLQTGGEYTC
jgi:hypothetical protein